METELAQFMADPARKRHTLTAAPSSVRALLHQLCEQYGLTSHAIGQEPNRCACWAKLEIRTEKAVATDHDIFLGSSSLVFPPSRNSMLVDNSGA